MIFWRPIHAARSGCRSKRARRQSRQRDRILDRRLQRHEADSEFRRGRLRGHALADARRTLREDRLPLVQRRPVLRFQGLDKLGDLHRSTSRSGYAVALSHGTCGHAEGSRVSTARPRR